MLFFYVIQLWARCAPAWELCSVESKSCSELMKFTRTQPTFEGGRHFWKSMCRQAKVVGRALTSILTWHQQSCLSRSTLRSSPSTHRIKAGHPDVWKKVSRSFFSTIIKGKVEGVTGGKPKGGQGPLVMSALPRFSFFYLARYMQLQTCIHWTYTAWTYNERWHLRHQSYYTSVNFFCKANHAFIVQPGYCCSSA